jgi:hypothetical protein
MPNFFVHLVKFKPVLSIIYIFSVFFKPEKNGAQSIEARARTEPKKIRPPLISYTDWRDYFCRGHFPAAPARPGQSGRAGFGPGFDRRLPGPESRDGAGAFENEFRHQGQAAKCIDIYGQMLAKPRLTFKQFYSS